MKLTGQSLANEYAKVLTRKLKGKVWCTYLGGGWIEMRGDGLPSHPDLRSQYPHGWSLLDRVRSGKARQAVAEAQP